MSGTLYGLRVSTNVQNAQIVANYHNVELKLVPVSFTTGELKQAENLARHPFGKVPSYESADGKVKLFESRAIARYIDVVSGGQLTGHNDPARLGLIESWASVESYYWSDPVRFLVLEAVFNPKFGKETDPAKVEQYKKQVESVLAVYEKHLADHNFLAGSEVSIADLFHVPKAYYVFEVAFPEVLNDKPNVKAWWARLAALPAWQKIISQKGSWEM